MSCTDSSGIVLLPDGCPMLYEELASCLWWLLVNTCHTVSQLLSDAPHTMQGSHACDKTV